MQKKLAYYDPADLIKITDKPDVTRFCGIFNVLKAIPLVDRTGLVKDPMDTQALFPMPQMQRDTRSFEDLSNARAFEILARADALNCDINLMWSGGIDSTLALVSLLKMATETQLKRIQVLLSEDSIAEAPLFYERHICGKLRMGSAQLFPYLLGSNDIFVSGEHSDQLFGSDMIGALIVQSGLNVIHKPYDRNLMERFFDPDGQNQEITAFYLDMFEYLAAHAPVPIDSNYLFLWWINFNLKWQSVYLRTLSYIADRNRSALTRNYVDHYFIPFFNTVDFQLWSMNNLDKRISGDWSTYKWVAKDIIFDFTKDDSYHRNKVKKGSLFFIILRKKSWKYIYTDFSVSKKTEIESWHTLDNHFQDGAAPWREVARI
jgi:hypothetical protein